MSGGATEESVGTVGTAWSAGVRAMVPVPSEHRRLEADETAVQAILRCKADDIEELCRSGIACIERDGVHFFDPVDVYNLGLLSGSGRTVPEVASSYFARLAVAGRDRWTAPVETEVTVDWPAEGNGATLGDEFGFLRLAGDTDGGQQTATYVPHGTVRTVASARLGALFQDMLADFSFQLLPTSLKGDAAAIALLGVGDCDGLSPVLAMRCNEAGFDATVESGHVRGGFGWGLHAWVRVEDEDGQPKALDPTLPLVAVSQGVDAGAFSRFCCGSLVTRVVPQVLRPAGGPPVSLSLPDTTIIHS